jgi:2'-5' RNA ligase
MYTIWFVFKKDDREYVSNIIKKVSIQYKSQVFVPHITAYGLVDVDLHVLNEIVTDSIKGEKAFIVEKSNLSYSNEFWKTLFVEFTLNTHLENINKKLTESLDSFSKYEFKPHMSLIYKKMSQDEQKKIVNIINVKKTFKVTEVWIQQFSKNIKKWKIVNKYVLE